MRPILVTLVLLALVTSGCLQAFSPPTKLPQDTRYVAGSMEVADFLAMWNLPTGDPAPLAVGDCADLLTTLNARLLNETITAIDQSLAGRHYGGGWAVAEGAVLATDDAASAADGGASRSAADAEVTGTNNQEQGVDEADVLKTDGEWTYVIRGASLHMLHAANVGDLAAFLHLDLGDNATGGTLLLVPGNASAHTHDRLVVISHHWERLEAPEEDDSDGISYAYWYGGRQWTRVRVYDLADRLAPDVVAEHWLEGRDVAARLVDGVAHIVVQTDQYDHLVQAHVHPTDEFLAARGISWDAYYRMSDDERRALLEARASELRAEAHAVIPTLTLADHLPRHDTRATNGDRVAVPWTLEGCQRFVTTESATGRSVTTIFSLDPAGATVDTGVTRMLGTAPIVYGAEDALVLASPTVDGWWFWEHRDLDEATDLHWFNLDGLAVHHRASGRVAGIVRDSFALDVHDGTLRVATTTGQWGRWWTEDPEPMLNHMLTFTSTGDALDPAGVVANLAPEENIWSARFTDDRAYIVTFEQIDPLWVIDLSDPTDPEVLGELEIPGVSTYIHPVNDDRLLTIGYGPRADGVGLDWGRLQVSLFDISDPTNPTRADVLDVSPANGYAWSDASHEHKAFTYWESIGKLAIPMTTYGSEWRQVDVGLRLIDVDLTTDELSVYGDVDQDSLMPNADKHDGYWQARVERSFFLGFPGTTDVSVYAMSSLGMTAHDLDTLAEQAAVSFPTSH